MICYMSVIRFKAKPYKINTWTVLRLPKEASVELPSRGQVMVKGTINDVPFQTPLEPDGNWSHWFRIENDLRKSAKVNVGDFVEMAIESTKEWPEPTVPADIRGALDANPDVQALWDKITPMARWEWLRWIGSTGKSETRQKRIEVACSKMRAGERRPCCFNRSMCCVPSVSKSGVLLEPVKAAK